MNCVRLQWENSLEVAQSLILLLEINDHRQFILSQSWGFMHQATYWHTEASIVRYAEAIHFS